MFVQASPSYPLKSVDSDSAQPMKTELINSINLIGKVIAKQLERIIKEGETQVKIYLSNLSRGEVSS